MAAGVCQSGQLLRQGATVGVPAGSRSLVWKQQVGGGGVLAYQRSPPAAEGPEKFNNWPGLTQEVAWPPRPETTRALPPLAWPKQKVAREGAPPSANLLSPELLPPAPHVGWTRGDPSQIGCPKTPRGAGPRPQTARRSGAASGFSVFAADPAEHHQANAQRHPPARPPDSPFVPPAARHATTNLQPQPSSRAARDREGRRRAGRGRRGSRVRGPHHGLQRAGAPAGRKQRTSGLRNVPACAVQLPPRHAGPRKSAGLVLQTAGPEATFPHADAHHPGIRAIAGAWGKRAELRGRVARIRPRSLGTSSSPRGKMGGQQKTVLSAGALLSPVLVDPEGPGHQPLC
ncbi:hypothetical protein R6Z07F_013097 [Ovis aries]